MFDLLHLSPIWWELRPWEFLPAHSFQITRPSVFKLLDIRVIILKEVVHLKNSLRILYRGWDISLQHPALLLLLVNKQIYTDCLPLYYRNTFCHVSDNLPLIRKFPSDLHVQCSKGSGILDRHSSLQIVLQLAQVSKPHGIRTGLLQQCVERGSGE